MNARSSSSHLPAPSSPPRRRRRALRWAMLALLASFLLLIAAAVATVALLQSEKGRAFIIAQVNKTGIVSLRALEGDLLHEVTLRDLKYENETLRLTLDRAHWRWNLRTLWQRKLSISELDAGTLAVVSKPAPPAAGATPSTPPESLTLPLAIAVDTLRLQRFVWNDGYGFDGIELMVSSSGSWHLVGINRLGMRRGVLEGALGVDGTAPFNVGGAISYRGTFEEQSVGFDFDIDGSLRDFHLAGQVFGEHMNIDSDGRFDLFAPYAYSMFHEAKLRIEDWDPSLMLPQLPSARLNIALDLEPLPDRLAKGTLSIENTRPGATDQNRVPLKTLSAEFEVQEDQIVFYQLDAAVLGGGRVEGQGWLREDQLRARLVADALDVAALTATPPGKSAAVKPLSRLSGEVWLEGLYRAPTARFDLKDALYQAALKFDLGWVDPERERRLAVSNAQLTHKGGTVDFSGEYDLDRRHVAVQGVLSKINPGALSSLWGAAAEDYPAGAIDGDFKLDGTFEEGMRIDAQYALRKSTLAGYPLSGEGTLRLTAEHAEAIDGWLQSGDSRLTVDGALGAAGDVLRLQATIPDLSKWVAGAAGRIAGRGEISGALSQLSLTAELDAESLRISELSAAQARLSGQAKLAEATLPFTLKGEVQTIAGYQSEWETLSIAAEGTRAQHWLTLTTKGSVIRQPVDVAARWQGGIVAAKSGGAQWQGELATLEIGGAVPLRMRAPMPIAVGATQGSIGPAVFAVEDSIVRLKNVDWQLGRQAGQAGHWSSEGAVEKIVATTWLKRAGFDATLRSDLVLSGDWTLAQDLDARGGGLSSLQGHVALKRETGDVQSRLTSRSNWQPLHLSQLALRAEIGKAQFRLDGTGQSSRYGKIEVTGDADLAAGPATADAALDAIPFNLRVHGELPDLSKIAPLIANGIKMGGRIQLDAQHRGTLRKASYSGALTGENLMFVDTVTGIALEDGDVALKLAQEKITIERFVFKGGRGTMSMRGGLDWQGGRPVAKLAFDAERLRLVRRSDMVLVVTGRGDLDYDEKGVSLNGKLTANYGSVQYRDSDVPALSDDVVMAGEAPQAPGVGLANVQFDVDLGNNFRFRGYGIDTRLTGALKLRARPNQALTAHGNVTAEDGTYRAYGQSLEIRRGVISFMGPIDNPLLDILAIRENSSVDAGVMVTGTAMRPSVALYSNPSMPTNEKLSWLLFDHGTENMDKGDSAILFQLLNSMLAGGDSGETLTGEMFGGAIDEINVASGQMEDGTTTQIVTVSKRLGKNLSVGLDKSLNGLQDAIRLTLRLSRRWSVITRFGIDDSSVDTRYTITF